EAVSDASSAFPPADTDGLALLPDPAGADAQDHRAARQRLERRDLPRQDDRVPGGHGEDRRAHRDGPRDRADEGQRHERLVEDVAALNVVHGHDDVVGDPHRIEAERFRLLGHVGDQSRRGIFPPMRETDAELHVETSPCHTRTRGSDPARRVFVAPITIRISTTAGPGNNSRRWSSQRDTPIRLLTSSSYLSRLSPSRVTSWGSL